LCQQEPPIPPPPTATQAVFTSTAPEISAWFADTELREREANEALGAFLRGLDNHDPSNPQVHIRTHTWGPTWWLGGVHGKEAPGPLWRESEPGLWVPNRRTKAGKELGAQVEAIGFKWKCVPGMPADLSVLAGDGRDFLLWPKVEALGGGGVFWCVWKVPEAQVIGSPRFDPALWQRAKLSEYYAAREAAETP